MLKTKRNVVIVAASVLVVIAATIFVYQSIRPSRSAAAYCTKLTELNTRLKAHGGNNYSLAIFQSRTDDPNEYVDAIKELEAVTPPENLNDLMLLRQIFADAKSDPTSYASRSLSGLGAEDRIHTWQKHNCK